MHGKDKAILLFNPLAIQGVALKKFQKKMPGVGVKTPAMYYYVASRIALVSYYLLPEPKPGW